MVSAKCWTNIPLWSLLQNHTHQPYHFLTAAFCLLLTSVITSSKQLQEERAVCISILPQELQCTLFIWFDITAVWYWEISISWSWDASTKALQHESGMVWFQEHNAGIKHLTWPPNEHQEARTECSGIFFFSWNLRGGENM